MYIVSFITEILKLSTVKMYRCIILNKLTYTHTASSI